MGKQESKRQREADGTMKLKPGLTYGEILFESFCLALKWIQTT